MLSNHLIVCCANISSCVALTSHPVLPSSFAFNLSQYQGLLQQVGSLHQVAKVLTLQLQHQHFQRVLWVDFL